MKDLQTARFHHRRRLETRRLGIRILAIATVLTGSAVLNMAGNPVYVDAANTQRSVQGRVVNSSDGPIQSAIVYLSDTRTKAVESYITQEDGSYRFEQLSPNDDYKLWAQVDGKKSKTKILSSFDDRSTFHVIIKIGSAKN